MNKLYKKIFAFVITTVMLVSGAAVLAASPEPTTRPRPESGQTQTTEKKSTDKSSSKSSDDEESSSKSSSKSSNDKDSSSKSSSKSSNDKDSDEKSSSADDKSNANENNKESVSITVETEAPKTVTTAAVSEKHYTTRGGAFGWFLLSILVNAVLSFAIGNRFYKMSKKNNHVSAEVRALRRDIEEKFNSNIGGFSEHDVEVSNSNESYAPDEGEIKVNVKKTEEEISAEETFREWEENLAKQEAEKREALREALKPKSTREFVEEEASFDNHKGEKAYKPVREPREEDDYDDEEEAESTFDSIKNKAKEIITDIFPFREDD